MRIKLQRKRTKEAPKLAFELFDEQRHEIEVGDLSELAQMVWTQEAESDGQVTVVLVDDAQLVGLNRRYLQRDTLTDVIAFTLSEPKAPLLEGEIYISVDRICENAQAYKTEPTLELHRVTVHGLLHLIGYEDGTTEEKNIMHALEDQYLRVERGTTVRS